jgi:hypothetical protein
MCTKAMRGLSSFSPHVLEIIAEAALAVRARQEPRQTGAREEFSEAVCCRALGSRHARLQRSIKTEHFEAGVSDDRLNTPTELEALISTYL